ncbi:putative ABC transport system permease protein [Actinoplanes campanulatus]|uniref:ABC transporter permease n=1 Tax=Actinoplanes campanulatus TaxID=113559 RepID=A0A7W5FDV0_9ACTN|nr:MULTISPECIES: ABC transporter permease [Actinoplanes]MBB3094809.1 putative ABC transport system permease protein [Actinoplanes campanulatus]GGN07557.1 ABC transporter permease [Actinoplanes campanulatus]GID36104.1 ABC transporter permease [Actinoplanes campanulatus]GID48105.1 ABC transporter permease [Actinoplanes capillaceus]
MRLAEAWRVALDALRANRLRSLLTMLGVVIGVAAVVALVAIGTGTKEQIERQVEGLGSNLLLVVPGRIEAGSAPTSSPLTLDDIDAINRVVGDRTRVAVTIASGETVRAGSRTRFSSMQGVLETTPTVFVRRLDRGSYLTRTDVSTGRRVAVLGAGTARDLFGDRDPIGRQITIGGVRFRVIGVFERLGQSLGVDRDGEVHVPVTAAQRLLGTERIDGIAIRAPDRERIGELSDAVVAALAERHPDTDFSAVTQEQILGVLGDILGVLTGVLAAIAGISLLVGGVGVSNIMLVSVRERTKEIGLRKAVGARPRDIGVQFLLEAVLLTTTGGVLGMLLGGSAALLVDRLSPVPAALTWWSMALAFGVSAAVGIIFGVVPAQRAGRLDPVVALRTE